MIRVQSKYHNLYKISSKIDKIRLGLVLSWAIPKTMKDNICCYQLLTFSI